MTTRVYVCARVHAREREREKSVCWCLLSSLTNTPLLPSKRLDILIQEQSNEVQRRQKDLEVQMALKDNEVALQKKKLENEIRLKEMEIEILEEKKVR